MESYPQLKNVELKDPMRTFTEVIQYIEKIYTKAKLVHGDLSEYNILYDGVKPIIIDVSQAVLYDHPHAFAFLYRDIFNVQQFFLQEGITIKDAEDIFEDIVGRQPKPTELNPIFW